MDVVEAVRTRRSVRLFLDREVDDIVLRRVVEQAAWAPSGGNVQPWKLYIFAGEPLRQIRQTMAGRLGDREHKETPTYEVYPSNLPAAYKARIFDIGEVMYASMGVTREEKSRRWQWFARNFSFFDAPVGLFCYVDQAMGPPQWSDLGMYLQTLMLLLRAAGLDSCAQECWSIYPDTVRSITGAPPELNLFCGMAIGHRDPQAPVNNFPQARVPVEEFANFHLA